MELSVKGSRNIHSKTLQEIESKLKAVDKGFYYKFNCSNEIKLLKYTFEDNGLSI